MVGTEVPLVPLVKANLKGPVYKKWLISKAELGNGQDINNAEAVEKLIDHYNREKGSKLI